MPAYIMHAYNGVVRRAAHPSFVVVSESHGGTVRLGRSHTGFRWHDAPAGCSGACPHHLMLIKTSPGRLSGASFSAK